MGVSKIVSWNVNGVRAITKKDFFTDVSTMDPDVLCLQETKATVQATKEALIPLEGYHIYGNESKARKGYSGTAIISKVEPINVTYDIGNPEHDQEGRVITAEYANYFVVAVYVPNSGEGLKRIDYRETWDKAFFDYCKGLEAQKPVIVNGDLNVAHTEIDIARPKPNYNKSAGYTQREIDGLERWLDNGFVDSFRHFYPEEVKYSWWNYRFNSRDRNVGWRIDYFLISEGLMGNVKDSMIFNEHYGSDHCPVGVLVEH
jgi:exodeoxyribonuclease-3